MKNIWELLHNYNEPLLFTLFWLHIFFRKLIFYWWNIFMLLSHPIMYLLKSFIKIVLFLCLTDGFLMQSFAEPKVTWILWWWMVWSLCMHTTNIGLYFFCSQVQLWSIANKEWILRGPSNINTSLWLSCLYMVLWKSVMFDIVHPRSLQK